jgi:hypothetical protein
LKTPQERNNKQIEHQPDFAEALSGFALVEV